MLKLLQQASGQKWLTWIGVILAIAGTVCVEHGAVIAGLIGPGACKVVAFLGTILAATGKGLADQRLDRGHDQWVRPSGQPQGGIR